METIAAAMFCAGAAWIAYVFAGYPVLVWVLGLVRPFRVKRNEEFTPRVSVLIAARNEEKDIAWKVRETLAWDYPPDRLEVLVASDASEDGTDDAVRGIGDPRVRLIRMERRGGKVRALNRLAGLCRSDLLFYTDANTHVEPDALRRMAADFADPRVGCVTGRTKSTASGEPVGAGAGLYWDYESRVAMLESRTGAVLVCDGAIHCARRQAVGELHPELANDLELPVQLRALGYRVLFEPRAVAHETETESAREEYSRRRRICGQGALGLWMLRGSISPFLAWQFASRKLLRWLMLVPLLFSLGGSALLVREPFFAAILLLQVAFFGTAAAAHTFPALVVSFGPWLAAPYYAVFGAAGAMRGVLDTLGGRRFDVWDIALLSRGH